jgi:signal transduction histidine kinase
VLKEPRLEVLLLQMRRNEKDFMLRQEQKYAQLFHQHEQELQQMLESVQFSKLDVKILNKQLADYGELFDVMVQTYAKFEHDVQKLHAMEEDLDEDLNQLHLLAESIAAEGLKDLDELAQEILFILVALLVLILVLVALFEVKVVRTMVDKINSLARGALKFSEGELDHRISVRGNDEFAMLAGMYNKMAVELGSSQRELEQFVYVASHDLQEPLRMVSSYTQLLAKRYEGQLDERADKYIHYAVDGATRMQSLINDLLEYSRINANPKALTRVSTQTLFNHAIMDLSVAIEEAKAEVKVDGELPDVIGDNVQLKQVFQNLISNAIKYNESTTPQVVISAKRKQNMWEISVADNGIGIPKEARQRAFQIFQRLHERDQYAGTGLGLAIVKKVMDQHQGSIRIESNEPHGSIFIFTLLAFEQYD